MAHDLEKNFHELRRELFQAVTGDFRAEFREFVGKTAIELVADHEPDQRYPGAARGETGDGTENLTPVGHAADSGSMPIGP